MKFNEQATVENYIIKTLSGVDPRESKYARSAGGASLVADANREKKWHLGYEYVPPEEFSKLREFENEFVITPLLAEAVRKINKLEDETEVRSVVREIRKMDTNEKFLHLMRYGVNLKDPQTGKMRDYKIVDLDNIGNNRFIVTNQFYFEGNTENIRPDVIIFLNGLPVVDIEAKSPTANSGVNYENAIDQLKRYERNAVKLFWPNCFNIASDGLKTVYGATYAPKHYFLEWKDEVLEKETGGKLEATLYALLKRENLLDIIKNFIVFEKTKEGFVKIVARYMQYRATNKIIERVKTGKSKRGLIWHTQGSGKSLTMFFTAWKLRFSKELKNPKVFVLVDRIDLDDQIFETFINCGGKNVERIISKRDLAKKIVSPERGIFISTMQKFHDLKEGIENDSENIIVLCDEGHRSNEGFASINLRASMKNAFFFGFTGTPIDRLTLNTHRNFGEQGERYLDYYAIKEAIDDGATLPVTYEARLSKFFIDEERIDEQFDEITTDLNEPQKEQLKKKYGKKEAIIKLEKRMRAIIQDIVEHYKLYVLPNGFKAQIVCYDREATATYKKILDELVPKEWSAVVYSPGDPNSDSDDLREYNTNRRGRETIIENFKNPEHPLKFLLVCDMLLTGFDAPIEQVMYLDKQLRGHNLLQAIARTNRVYPNKGCGKIIDYYGITRNLEAALDFDESEVDSAMINIDEVKKQFENTITEVLKIFSGVNIDDPSIDNLRKCLKIFADSQDKQAHFIDFYSKLKVLFEIISPDPFLKKFLRPFEWITSFYLAFMKEYFSEESDAHLLAGYGEKLKELIQDKIDYEGITKNFREMKISDMQALEQLKKMDDESKAMNLEKMLKREISINIDTNPVFKKFSERLMLIKKEFEKNQIDLAERIKRYYELLEDIRGKGKEAENLGMNLKEYGLYAVSSEYVENYESDDLKQYVKELCAHLTELLDEGWQESSKRDVFINDVKRTIQEITLKDYKDRVKVKDFSKYLNRLVDIIIKKF